ncbi:MAG: hypothetical protein WB471_15435 [Nocardioides sp.]
MTLTSFRRAIAAAAVVSLSVSLSACGSDEEPSEDQTPVASSDPTSSDETDAIVLDEDQMTPALLTLDDLPAGFAVDPDDSDDSEGGFEGSCLEDVSNLTDQPEFDADEEVEASYILEGDAGQSSVQSQVQSYADAQQITSAISMFSEAVGACESAQGTDADGFTYDLEVRLDQTASLEGVDEQTQVSITGTLSTDGLELPVDIGFDVARAGNNLVIISTLDVGEAGEGIVAQTDALAQVSVDRLAEING